MSTRSGELYLSPDLPGGVDPTFKGADYVVQNMVYLTDVTKIRGMEVRLAASEATIAGMTEEMLGMQRAFDTEVQERADERADLQARLDRVEAWMSSFTPGGKVDNRGDGTVAPVITAENQNVMFSASNGDVTFLSAGCDATDLCDLAKAVEGLQAKFTKQ